MAHPSIDPTFYRTAAEAAAAPGEQLAYVVAFDRAAQKHDAMTVIDVNAASDSYGRVVGWTDVPGRGDELHHFGWNACSSALKHEGHDMHGLERRYLLVPGLRSSSIHVFDTQPDPRNPTLIKTIDGKSLSQKAGYSRPHTLHCGPDGVFLTCLGGPEGNDDGPGGDRPARPCDIRRLACLGDRPRATALHYDAWWHLNQNVLISSEWGSPSMIENGIVPELLLGQKYGHAVHFWDLAKGEHTQRVDLGAQHQMALEVRPSHDPRANWGFVGVVISTEDLSGSVWRWFRDEHEWKAEKVISIPAEPADPNLLPPHSSRSARCRRWSPTSTCRSTTGSCTCRAGAPASSSSSTSPTRYTRWRPVGADRRHRRPRSRTRRGPTMPLAGGPQMVEVSRDGKRVYFTNSLYGAWDDQFYPDGVGAWMAKLDVGRDGGHQRSTSGFFPQGEAFRGRRVHQVRLQGGDASVGLVLLQLIPTAPTNERHRRKRDSTSRYYPPDATV